MVTPNVRREVPGKSSPPKAKPKHSDGFLSTVDESSDVEDIGLSLIVYGKEGVGKTSLAANAPSPIFLIDKQEHGIHRLKQHGLVPRDVKVGKDIDSWSQLLDALDELSEEQHSYETVVCDSLTGFQRLCFDVCCKEQFQGDMSKEGFFAYSNGPKTAAQAYWPDFIDRLTNLQQQNINVILLGHSVVKPYANPTGPDFDRIMCDLDKAVWAVTARWAGAVLYLAHNIDITKDGRKMKGKGGEQRILYTEYDAVYDAKNSFGLPPVLDPFSSPKEGWDDLWRRIKGEQLKKKKSA